MTARALLSDLPAFAELQVRASALKTHSIDQLFLDEPDRAEQFSLEAAGLQLDFSKHLLDKSTWNLLLQLATQAQLNRCIDDLFSGALVNKSEKRAALHTLLRATENTQQAPQFDQVMAVRDRMQAMTEAIITGEHTGYAGTAITDIVNLGIGGSDLGPRLVTQALRPFHGKIQCHYVANVDPADLANTLSELNAATTLFIVCSKSFRTEETLANGLAARGWLLDAGASEKSLNKHFLAVTNNLQAAQDFGIDRERCLPMWDWVGGRYSVWSAVGISCAIAIGWERFMQFLAGAEAMDQHFRCSEAHLSLPLTMSLLEVWYGNFLGAQNQVVVPYDHSLRNLPNFLQQLTMESNGKQMSTDSQRLLYPTAPILWGAAGTIGQHSFHQLLHQGQLLCPVDFILPLNTHNDAQQQHCSLIANCLAQSRALMIGRSVASAKALLLQRGLNEQEADHLAPQLAMPGNRPSSVITMRSLCPRTLGALLALYEHRTFCSAQLWRINPFDQWGVELGKQISADILQILQDKDQPDEMDASTKRLIQKWRSAQR